MGMSRPLNRVNSNNIQLLSKEIHSVLFPNVSKSKAPEKRLLELSKLHLEHNGLADKPTSQNDPISFNLPPLLGPSISHHFKNMGKWSQGPYLGLIDDLFQLGNTPVTMPETWEMKSGWVKYQPGKAPVAVPYPDDNALVFDTEVLYKLSPYPIMATALGANAWYAWVSPFLTGESTLNNHLITLGPKDEERLIVGHNVSYDRARVLEEYQLDQSKAFYLDTMSLHVSVSGMCSRQRNAWMKYKKNLNDSNKSQEKRSKSLSDYRGSVKTEGLRELLENEILDQEIMLNTSDSDADHVSSALNEDPWLKHSSMSSLAQVAEHHCNIQLDKTTRDHFASLDPNEIIENFQMLMQYCANDVLATYHVFHKIWPEYKSVVPHPISFSALRHITQSFLPTTSNWNDYITKCEQMYQDSKIQIESKLNGICNGIVEMKEKAEEKPWENDPWLSQLDWEITPIRYTKAGELFKRQKLPGFPNWYKKIAESNGDLNLTTKTRISALLLNLSWDNNPIIWTEIYGWCFTTSKDKYEAYLKKSYEPIDVHSLLPPVDSFEEMEDQKAEDAANTAADVAKPKRKPRAKKGEKSKSTTEELSVAPSKPKAKSKTTKKKVLLFESDPVVIKTLKDVIKEDKIVFKIPHENGPGLRVTSLMTKPFQRYFENGTLSSSHPIAVEAISLSVQNSYWVSSRERISSQFVVYKDNKDLNVGSFNNEENMEICPIKPPNNDKIGIIIPQIIPMGTITRRSVEKTWLTASNAKKNRLGSELKSLIRAPPGYCFVGADVDSEELWIASLMGDAVFGAHGGSALGWMTLEGTKNEGTDLHSKTAKILGISRGEAKVFNYGRIYGAGKKFATTLLKKFNPEIGDKEAADTATNLYSATKGMSGHLNKVRVWYGGSESVVFNRLEQIAEQDYPKTPVLGAGITQALQKNNLNANSFLPSRINWAIQSSGVDYLHLLLVSMEFLCKYYSINARLAITVHDEVRFMTKWEDRYKCAMALQIANLWTRAMFCYQVGIDDVPQSCAFFSAVDIDWILRKEVDFECVTPSSPDKLAPGESLDINELLKVADVQKMLELKPEEEFWKQQDNGDDEEVLTLKKTKFEHLKKPTESLDKDLDVGTKSLWVKLQICQNEKEFQSLKNNFFDEVRMGQRKAFSKKLKNESLNEDVLTNVQLKSMKLPEDMEEVTKNSGVIIDSVIDEALNNNQMKKSRSGSRRKQSKAEKEIIAEDFNIQDILLNKITNGTNVKFSDSVVSKSEMRKAKIKGVLVVPPKESSSIDDEFHPMEFPERDESIKFDECDGNVSVNTETSIELTGGDLKDTMRS